MKIPAKNCHVFAFDCDNMHKLQTEIEEQIADILKDRTDATISSIQFSAYNNGTMCDDIRCTALMVAVYE